MNQVSINDVNQIEYVIEESGGEHGWIPSEPVLVWDHDLNQFVPYDRVLVQSQGLVRLVMNLSEGDVTGCNIHYESNYEGNLIPKHVFSQSNGTCVPALDHGGDILASELYENSTYLQTENRTDGTINVKLDMVKQDQSPQFHYFY